MRARSTSAKRGSTGRGPRPSSSARCARSSPRRARRTRCDGEPLKIWRARVARAQRRAGTVLDGSDELVVGCGEGALRIARAAARRRQAARRGASSCAGIRLRARRALRMSARALAQALRDAARDRGARRRAARASPASSSASPRKRSDTPRAALLDLTHGTLRRYGRVQAIVAELSRRGAPDRAGRGAAVVRALCARIGRYARVHGGRPGGARLRGCSSSWNAKGYVNALLRSFLRERAALEARIARRPRGALPASALVDRRAARSAYPERWEAGPRGRQLASADGLRVNRRRSRRRGVSARGSPPSRHRGAPHRRRRRCCSSGRCRWSGCRDSPRARSRCRTPARSARRAASISPTGQRVLDACAAPGRQDARTSSRRADVDAHRARRRRRALRAHRRATSSAWACAPQVRDRRLHARSTHWWDGVPFDRILADVPCSASGVARRHPDIKWLRRAQRPRRLRARQARSSTRFGRCSRRVVNCCMSPARCFRRRTKR